MRRRYGGKMHLGSMGKREGIFTPFTIEGAFLLPFATALAKAASYAAASSALDSGSRVGAQGALKGPLATSAKPAGVKRHQQQLQADWPSTPVVATRASKSFNEAPSTTFQTHWSCGSGYADLW
jgi:hypothetical protein